MVKFTVKNLLSAAFIALHWDRPHLSCGWLHMFTSLSLKKCDLNNNLDCVASSFLSRPNVGEPSSPEKNVWDRTGLAV